MSPMLPNSWRELERAEARVLAALRCVDATTHSPIEHALQIEGGRASLIRNRSGLYVIRDWPDLAAHIAAFDAPPATPALGSAQLMLTVRDPSGNYLPRLVRIDLPRDPDPAHADDLASLFQPIDVLMYPSGIAPLGANWAALRVSLTEFDTGDALGGALLRVVSNGEVLARGMTDWRGEAIVPVAGIPVTTWSSDPHAVIVSEIAVTLEAIFDATVGGRVTNSIVRAGRAPDALPIVDPIHIDDIRATLPSVVTPLQLAAGRALNVSLRLNLP